MGVLDLQYVDERSRSENGQQYLLLRFDGFTRSKDDNSYQVLASWI